MSTSSDSRLCPSPTAGSYKPTCTLGRVCELWIGPCGDSIYFFHDPREARRSLGTLNILHLIEAARHRGLPHAYLGYYVDGCRSLEYKATFKPNEIFMGATWETFVA